MSGAVSGAQFIPHANPTDDGNVKVPDLKTFGIAGREFSGLRTLTPIAKGAFSTQDQALAFRHQGDNTMSSGAKNIGSWLFKSE
jgi:hypothetical protein